MRRYLVTLDIRLPNNADDGDYVMALIKAAAKPVRARLVPDGKTPLVSDGNEPASDGNGGYEEIAE